MDRRLVAYLYFRRSYRWRRLTLWLDRFNWRCFWEEELLTEFQLYLIRFGRLLSRPDSLQQACGAISNTIDIFISEFVFWSLMRK